MEKEITLMESFPIYGYENNSLISKEKGCITIPIEIKLPDVFTLDQDDYDRLNRLNMTIIDTLGPNTLIHRQNYFLKEKYTPIIENLEGDPLQVASENHFTGRECFRLYTYWYISIVPNNYFKSSANKVNRYLKKKLDSFFDYSVHEDYMNSGLIDSFHAKVSNVCNLINECEIISANILTEKELFNNNNGLFKKYYTLSNDIDKATDISFDDNTIHVGNKRAQFYTIENLDQFTNEDIHPYNYYRKFSSESNPFPIGNLFSIGFKIPFEHIINEYTYIPEPEKVIKGLRNKAKNFKKYGGDSIDDNNVIYANQIYEFNKEIIETHKDLVFYHLNVVGFTDNKVEFNTMCQKIKSAFNNIKLKPIENTLDRKNLFFAGVPGNAIGISSDMYMPMPSDMASYLSYYEGEYSEPGWAIDGVRLVDRINGRPLSVSWYKKPEELGWIFNRGTLVASGSGGGKSYIANHYFASELRTGAHIIIMEDGDSYEKLVKFYGGIILENNDEKPYTFAPFKLDKYDYVNSKEKGKKLSEEKIVSLVTLLLVISGGVDQKVVSVDHEVRKTVLENSIVGYYQYMWENDINDFSFNTYYEYLKNNLEKTIRDKKIEKVFDINTFFFLLEKYYKGGVREDLLNKDDDRIGRLSSERLIYFKLTGIIDNELLFPIFSLMIMEIFNKKLLDKEKRHINKILNLDEAWKVLVRPELEDYFNAQSRLARKYGGQPMFISQKVDDFLASEVIKNAIVVNSHIKVFLDMNDLEQNFDPIQQMMGLTDKQRKSILSINKDLPEDRKLREVAIAWKSNIKVYGIETSLEEKCIYETKPNEVKKINTIFDKHRNWEITAKTYAGK
ncbi:Bacteroides conjugation system ATPase, TraG family [Tenacibaculum sp. MAR_2009_124]|uniref:TraG family conjugative transposon ATPase n=1 Tax=Tenacibaculum sp. MAR_2009_124 TaxID=1250059 RepID=UPI0008956A06|nr:TraG family conjugative transposon ATPase [Tenacibaculum sp. MAR_2009_124]SEC65420.1 Bacteroides conjugation system ATPase, TraG family [Tenacibaculum sp. MAR_2009_124]